MTRRWKSPALSALYFPESGPDVYCAKADEFCQNVPNYLNWVASLPKVNEAYDFQRFVEVVGGPGEELKISQKLR